MEESPSEGSSSGSKRDKGKGKRGTLIFTSATAAWRGNVMTSAVAAGKCAQRALSQSLNKEFGRQNIHVSVGVDGLFGEA